MPVPTYEMSKEPRAASTAVREPNLDALLERMDRETGEGA